MWPSVESDAVTDRVRVRGRARTRVELALSGLLFLTSLVLAQLLPLTAASFYGATWPVMAAGLAAFALGMFSRHITRVERPP